MTTDDKVSDLIRDPQAWQGGYAAGRRSLTDTANPYPLGSCRALSWQGKLACAEAEPSA